jgi:hypothetical protein
VFDVQWYRGANIVILHWQRPLWEGDWEVVKRSGRDEPVWVVIHMCMEAMLGKSLCIAILISNWQKRCVFLIAAYVFSSTKLEKRAEQVLPGSEGGGGRGREQKTRGRDGPNNVCTYE